MLYERAGEPGGGGSGGSNSGVPAGGGAGSGGAPAPTDWRSGLTGEFEALRGEKSLEVVKGKDFSEAGPALAKMVVSGQKLLGDSIRIPGANAKPEEVAAYRAKLGIPTSVEGYKDVKLPDVKTASGDTLPWDAKMLDEFAKPGFMKAGLNPQQAQDVLGMFAEYTQRVSKATLDSYFAGQDKLAEKWGLAFDNNVKRAYRTASKFFSEPFMALVKAAQLDAHSDFIQGMYDISNNFDDDPIVDGSEVTDHSMDDLDKKISETRGKIATLAAGSQERTKLEADLEKMYKARYPEQRRSA